MIETKDTSELFERLEREFADERHVLDEMERNVREVERLVPPEIAPRPSRTKKVVAGVLAGLAIAAAGVGAGMAIQYYGETQPAQDQVTTLQGEVATLNGYTLYNAPSARIQLSDEMATWSQKANTIAPLPAPAPVPLPMMQQLQQTTYTDHIRLIQGG